MRRSLLLHSAWRSRLAAVLRSTPFRSHSRCQALLFSAASLDHNKALRCCIMMRPLRLRTAHPPLPQQVIQYAPAMFSVEPPANNVFGLCASSNTFFFFFFSSPFIPRSYISAPLYGERRNVTLTYDSLHLLRRFPFVKKKNVSFSLLSQNNNNSGDQKKDRPFNSSLSIARFSTSLDWLRIALAGSLHSYICALEQTPNKQLIACQSNCQSDVVFSCRFPLFCF